MTDLLEPLALHGGPRRACDVTAGWPPQDEEVLEALKRAFRDGSWGSYHGRCCRELCDALAAFFQTPWVTLCCSGTFAVELALRAAGVTTGSEVILAGYDFPGNFRAIEAIGAVPVLVDLDPETWNLDVRQVDAACTTATKAILAAHLHGGLVAMAELMPMARARGLAVVEDACQAHGALVQGRLAGTWGDVGVLSFGGSKLLTAGRGGAIITAREELHQRAKIYCERGNQTFPLSELQASVLLPQLHKLKDRNAARAACVERLIAGIEPVKWLRSLASRLPESQPAYYKLGLRYEPTAGQATREEFVAAAQAEGVPLDAGFRGFALRSSRRCRVSGELTQSRLAAERMLVLHHPILLQSGKVMDTLAAALLKVQWHLERTPSGMS